MNDQMMDQRSDIELLSALHAMIERCDVRLELDAAKLDHMDSPVSVQSESTRWFAMLFAACAIALWSGGWIAGVAASLASAAAWFGWVRPATRRRIAMRVHTAALRDVQLWRQLWRFGGVRLVAGDEQCAAPNNNWMQFVRDRSAPTLPT